MNLTYEEVIYKERSPEECAFCHSGVAQSYTLAKQTGATGAQLGGVFSKITDSLKRTIKHPIEMLKATAHGPKAIKAVLKDEARAVKQDVIHLGPGAAAVLQFFPGVGTVIGAGVGALSAKFRNDAQKKAQALAQAAGDGGAMVAEYKQIEGTVPGRFIGVDTVKQLFKAAFDAGELQLSGGTRMTPALLDSLFSGGARNGCLDIEGVVKENVAAGNYNANDITNQWLGMGFSGGGTCGSHAPWTNPLARSLLRDAVDAYIGKMKSDAPFSYAVTDADFEQPQAPQSVPVAQSAPTLQPISIANPSPASTTFAAKLPISTTKTDPNAAALVHAGVDPNVTAQVNALMAQMQRQGADQAQMMSAALSALTARGVNTSAPQIVEAVKADAGAIQSGGFGNATPWLIGAAALAAVFFLTRRKRS